MCIRDSINAEYGQMEKMFREEAKLGQGGYGIVYSATEVKTKNKIAVKKCKHVEDNAVRSNMREVYYLSITDSPSIVKFQAAFVLPELGEMWSVLEYMEGGTLTEARKSHTWSQPEVAYIARELFKAVEYLHSINIIHRDIKSGNVMFTVKAEVKLIDFGLATNVPQGKQSLKGMVGSAFWIPPEMIRGLTHDKPADVWSSAQCLMELINGHIPHYDEEAKRAAAGARAMFLIGTGVRAPFEEPNKWDANCMAFFDSVLEFEPEKRATPKQALQHAFISGAAPQEDMAKMLVGVFQQQALSMF
eukprot:TRINITY_DN860_c0_g1_i1.p2 TRINITY_DN860_c0_g1~~TRINITY_DN860_c0_g1_i1.p2  ORF type:complete len:303 (-),score=-7.66 TRINITY_DN860_c0_g1_i1:34-942(-)